MTRKIDATAHQSVVGAAAPSIPIIARCEDSTFLHSFVETVYEVVLSGHRFGWHVEGEDGRARLAFLIRAEDGVYKIEPSFISLATSALRPFRS